jgi:multidrug efflux pump subunit AcrB
MMKSYIPTDIAGKLAKSFLHSPLTALLGLFILAIGYLSLEIMPREENPQMIVSGSNVIVALPGATATEIENVIIKPLERKLKEIKGAQHIYGVAMDNVGVVTIAFEIGQNKEESNLKVYDKIMQNLGIFPKGIQSPIIKPLDIDIDIPILSIAFYTDTNSPMHKTQLHEKIKTIQHQINALDNVAITNIIGGAKKQFNIEVDLHKLAGYNLSLGQITQSIKSLATNVPNIKNHTNDGKIAMVGIKNAIESQEDIGDIIVAIYHGSAIHLRDIATITLSSQLQNFKSAYITVQNEDHSFSGLQEQITLSVSKLAGSNAVNIADAIKEELLKNSAYLEKNGIKYTITRNDGERANEAVNELVFHLLISIVIIAVLLIVVLGYREALIVTFSVPAILAITLFVAYLGDQTINRITLFAFLLSLGLLVDAAIIVIENIHRHFHSVESADEDIDTLLIKATDEIGAPTNIATLAIIMTMVPMFFVGDMMGQFMKPIPANVPVSLIASLFIAYIFTPYLARKIMKRPKHILPTKEETN